MRDQSQLQHRDDPALHAARRARDPLHVDAHVPRGARLPERRVAEDVAVGRGAGLEQVAIRENPASNNSSLSDLSVNPVLCAI